MTGLRSGRSSAANRWQLLIVALWMSVLCAVPTGAAADTIYLKNGRVIHTERTRVEDETLVFSQHGGTVSIPLDTVERVEKDAKVETASVTPPDVGSALSAAPRPAPEYPWDRAEYWAERLIEIDRRIERVEAELDRLPVYSEADQRVIISGQVMYFVAERARWEGFHVRLLRMRQELERSARKAGITPGALRKARQRRAAR